MDKIEVSSLGKTWIFDIDGTIVKHNGYLTEGQDTLLDGAAEFFDAIPEGDVVILITSRTEEYSEITEDFLRKSGIRYDYIIFGLPYGERILVNDRKPSGLKTSVAVNTERNVFMDTLFEVNDKI